MLRRFPVAVALCTASILLPVTPAAAATAPFPIDLTPAAAATKPVATQTLLRRLEGASRRELAPLVKELAARYPRLRGAERRAAARYLARPTDGAQDQNGNGYTVPEALGSPYCTAHYCIHWVPLTADAPDLTDANVNGVPDHVEEVATVAENVYSVENGALGWRAPLSDGTRGGGAATDIYLAQLGGTGIYGYTSPDPDQQNGHSLSAFLVIDNDFAPTEFKGYASPLLPEEVTLAHEYNHVLHFTYDAQEDTWMFEATAVWMEDKVYNDINDYLQYLTGWAQLTTQPMTKFNGTNPSDRTNVKVYGSAVWTHWLAARYQDVVVRTAWENSQAAKSFAPDAFDSAIKNRGGHGFFDEFSRFAAATAEWRSTGSGFLEGAFYPDVQRVGELQVDGKGGVAKLDHTAYALVNVTGASQKRLKVAARVPRGTAGAIALVARTGDVVGGTATVKVRELPKGGAGSVSLANPAAFSRLTAVLINADTKQSGYDRSAGDWIFKRDGQSIRAVASTDFTPPRVKRVSGSAKSVEVKFSEPMLGVSRSTLRLIAPDGRKVSAKVTFKAGESSAKLRPSTALAPGGRYRVEATAGVTDVSFNSLRRSTAQAFRVG